MLQAQAARIVARKQPNQLDDSLSRIENAGSDALFVRRYENHRPPVILTLPEVDTGAWPPEVSTTVFRIVQESLTNIARHSPNATTVAVTVDHSDATGSVAVEDDGPP